MSDTGRDADLIPDATKDNYRTKVTSGATTWADLTVQFRCDADTTVSAVDARGYSHLAAWAQAEHATETAAAERAAAARPAKQRDPRKAVDNAPRQAPGPARTAV